MRAQVVTFALISTAAAVVLQTEQAQGLQHEVVDYTYAVSASHELNELARQLDRHRINSPIPSAEAFPAFVRESMHSYDQDRDVTLDPWGQTYRLERNGDRYIVLSCGPDGLPHTSDDLSVALQKG